jgi:hypothetical protein
LGWAIEADVFPGQKYSIVLPAPIPTSTLNVIKEPPCAVFLMKKLLTLALILGSLIISGCKTHRYAGAPPPAYNVDKDIKELEQVFKQSSSISDFYSSPANQTEAERNKFITGRLVLINLNYYKWLRNVTADKQLLDSASDILVMSLNLAATAVGGKEAKTILSAVSAGVAGSKTTIDKYYFYEKTVPALAATMNAQRKQVLINIIKGLDMDLKQYPFEQAVSDLNDYYMAGTFQGAISTIQADAGTKETAANNTINFLKTWSYSEDDSGITIFNFLFQNGDSTKPVAANIKAFKEWRDKLGDDRLKDVPIEKFIHDPSFKDLREQAIREIPIK